MIVAGTFSDRWIGASQELRAEIFEMWIAVHRLWQERGCRLIATMDEANVAGRPDGTRANFFTVWEIPDPTLVRELLEMVWDEYGERPLRLAEYFSLTASVGKPIVTMELDLGGPQRATAPQVTA
jgi:hypothetical protein